MDYRKLISFGKNSYVISLPKSWIRQNKLKKGDLVALEERGSNIVINAKEDEDVQEKVKTIPVDGKTIRRLQREIISAYIKDYKTIILQGDSLKEKAKEIQQITQNLMALEVMEQTSKKIVARDFLDMNSISIFNMVRKVDVIVRAMMEDCQNMFVDDNCENIAYRDNDVNRLSFLVFRVVEFGLGNTSFMYKKHGLTSKHLLHLWWFMFNLESVADEVKRTSRYMKSVKLDKRQQDRFLKLLSETKESYLAIMKAFHTKDEEIVHGVLEAKTDIIKATDAFYNDNRSVEGVGLLVERLKSMINCIHNMGRVVYQSDFTEK